MARSVLAIVVLFLLSTISANGDSIGVAHRGGRIQGPENTLEVFQLTINLGVTPWLETDAWTSSDGVLVLHHDLDMCRTTDIGTTPGFDCVVPANNPLGRFPWIRDFTAAELKTFDAGSWFSPAFAGVTLPTLEEALNLVDGTGVPLLVEIKTSGQAVLIEEILTRTGLSQDNLIIWARQPFSYDLFHSVIPGIRQITGLLPLSAVTDSFLAARAAAGDYGISIQAVGLDQALVDKIHSYGLLIYSLPGGMGGDPVLQQIPLGVDAFSAFDELYWEQLLLTLPCVDRVDNDSDGFADFEGIDLDFDGIHDIPPDPACTAHLDTTEVAECQDLIDNDGDGFTDLADPECVTANTLLEEPVGLFCGDGIITLPETCDDSNVLVGDGCYSNCRIEDSLSLFGVAEGGSVTVTISGVDIVATTIFGETPQQVAVKLAMVANADTTLQSLDISAAAVANRLVTDGTIDSHIIADSGLASVQASGLTTTSWLMLAASLIVCGLSTRGRRRSASHQVWD